MKKTKAYRSKIGKLPFALRTELNHRIRDGITGPEIIAWLNATPEFKHDQRTYGYADINAQNLTDWRSTGYKHWLADQDRTAHIRDITEFSRTLVSQAGGNIAGAGCDIIAGKILEGLSTVEEPTEDLVKALVSLKKEETNARKTDLAEDLLALKQKEHELSRDKFEAQTAELFLRWFQDKKAVAIASSNSSHENKIKALRSFIHNAIQDED